MIRLKKLMFLDGLYTTRAARSKRTFRDRDLVPAEGTEHGGLRSETLLP